MTAADFAAAKSPSAEARRNNGQRAEGNITGTSKILYPPKLSFYTHLNCQEWGWQCSNSTLLTVGPHMALDVIQYPISHVAYKILSKMCKMKRKGQGRLSCMKKNLSNRVIKCDMWSSAWLLNGPDQLSKTVFERVGAMWIWTGYQGILRKHC